MNAKHLTPILNVADIAASFVWFEKFGWRKCWEWGTPPTFGAVGSGKCEIFLGLTAAGVGLLLGCHFASRPVNEIEWGLVAATLALIVFGGYLTLAGHRNHLYQSSFEQTAFLIEEMQILKAGKETHA